MLRKDFKQEYDTAFKYLHRSGEFQALHYELRKDFGELYKITAISINNGNDCPELIRACLREFFSLIEADVFFLNYIDSYDEYDDHDSFVKKFKKTYTYHCKKHDRYHLYKDLVEKHFGTFKDLKRKRDLITHPKSAEDLKVDNELFVKTYTMFKTYVDFVANLMNKTGISMSFNTLGEGLQVLSKFSQRKS